MENLLSLRYNQKFEGLYGKHLPDFGLVKKKIVSYVSKVIDSDNEFNGVHLEVMIDNYLDFKLKTVGDKEWLDSKLKTLIINNLLVYPSIESQKVEYELHEGSFFSNPKHDKIIGIYPIREESFTPDTSNTLTLYKENIFNNLENYDFYFQRKMKEFLKK